MFLSAAIQDTASTVADSIVATGGVTTRDIIAMIGLTLVVIQLGFVIHGQRRDHDRRKKQVTIAFTGETYPQILQAHYELEKALGDTVVDQKLAKEIIDSEDDPGRRHKISFFLNRLETIATAANTGVFDRELLNRLAGSFIIHAHEKYMFFIRAIRTKMATPTVFKELEALVDELKKLRKRRTIDDGSVTGEDGIG